MTRSPRIAILGVLTLALSAACAGAQALSQLPQNPYAIFKINNAQSVSQKIASVTKKLGIADIEPAYANPLATLKNRLGIQQGMDDSGDIVVAVYPSGPDEMQPRMLALLPVSDYRAFLGNFQKVNQQEGLSSFTLPNEMQVFAAERGKFAAISASRELLASKPAGVELTDVLRNQLDTTDIVAFASPELVRNEVLPRLKQARQRATRQIEREAANQPPAQAEFLPAIRLILDRTFGTLEQTLSDTRGAVLGTNIATEGITLLNLVDFAAGTQAANVIKTIQLSDQPLVKNLPQQPYFLVGGVVSNPATAGQMVDNIVQPLLQQLPQDVSTTRPVSNMADALKAFLSAMQSASFGYLAPTGAAGQQSILQPVAVYKGNAAKMAEAQKQALLASTELMAIMPRQAGAEPKITIQPNAVEVDGASFDRVVVNMNLDRTTPEGAQAGQAMDFIYGPDGMNGYIGAVDENTYLKAYGVSEAQLRSIVAAARQPEPFMANLPKYQAVSDQLPKNRAAVAYLSLDTIANVAQRYMAQQGFRVPIQLPPDLPPIGMAVTTQQQSAIQGTVYVPTDLLEALISAAIQLQMQQGGGGGGM